MRRLLFFLIVCISSNVFAQVPQGAFSTTYHTRKVVPNEHVREADILWSKTVWRMLDLKQRKNHHFFFPEQRQGSYQSLIHVLVDLVNKQGVGVYGETDQDEFALSMTNKELESRLGKKEEWIQVGDPVLGGEKDVKVTVDFNPSEVKRYLVKEVWYFDSKRSKVDVRILGLCPVREYYKEEDIDQEEPKYAKVGWFYFPEIEKHLVRYPAMNGHNESWKWTYYDVFRHRYFESVIVQVGNVFNNRPISDYAMGEAALLESKRIENEIRNFELDLWSY